MAGEAKRAVIAAVVGNLLIAVAKFIAAAFSGSAAMLSEAIHSLVDTGNDGLMLYGMRRTIQAQYPRQARLHRRDDDRGVKLEKRRDRHARESGHPGIWIYWIPASAGMT